MGEYWPFIIWGVDILCSLAVGALIVMLLVSLIRNPPWDPANRPSHDLEDVILSDTMVARDRSPRSGLLIRAHLCEWSCTKIEHPATRDECYYTCAKEVIEESDVSPVVDIMEISSGSRAH